MFLWQPQFGQTSPGDGRIGDEDAAEIVEIAVHFQMFVGEFPNPGNDGVYFFGRADDADEVAGLQMGVAGCQDDLIASFEPAENNVPIILLAQFTQ